MEKIIPSSSVRKQAQKFVKTLKLKDVKFELGGSVAKDTHLKGSSDVDVFARFKHNIEMSDVLESYLSKFSPVRVHGSRDYFQFFYEGLKYEIVPVLYVKKPEQAKNVTDMSPLHVSWAKKYLNKKLRNDIRLTKQFCKAQKIYGAESHIRGFSGHVLDILIIHYNGFHNLLQHASVWGDKVIIDVKKFGTATQLNSAKTEGPMIVIDPIQNQRNAAAGLGKEAFVKFRKAARKYLETGDDDLFVEKMLSWQAYKKAHKNAYKLEFIALKGKEDVVGSKIRSALKYVERELEEFIVEDLVWDFKQAFFSVKNVSLSKEIILKGPPTSKKKDVLAFKKKHEDWYIKDFKLHAKEKRKHTTVKSRTNTTLKLDYITKRFKKICMK